MNGMESNVGEDSDSVGNSKSSKASITPPTKEKRKAFFKKVWIHSGVSLCTGYKAVFSLVVILPKEACLLLGNIWCNRDVNLPLFGFSFFFFLLFKKKLLSAFFKKSPKNFFSFVYCRHYRLFEELR